VNCDHDPREKEGKEKMSSKRIALILIASLVVLAVGVGPRLAANSQALLPAPEPEVQGTTIPYSGRLTDEDGGPVAEGIYAFTFGLYGAETGGEPLWSEMQEGVRVEGGALSTALGAVEPIPPAVLGGRSALWLALGVRGPGEAEFTALSPRQRLRLEAAAAPASTSNGQACPHDHLYEAWVGTDGMTTFSIANNGDGDGIWGTAQGSGAGVHGVGWNGPGVKGSSVHGRGVEGFSSSTSEWAPAVYGSHDGAGDGVYGVSENRHGVYGVTKSTAAGSAGVYARNDGGGPAVHSDGDMYIKGNVGVHSRASGLLILELGEGLDYAEGFDVSQEQEISPGMVLVIDPHHPGELTVSERPYDRRVAGIVAGARGLGSGVRLGADRYDYDVALAGRVYCYVDATEAAVQPGDLLTTSTRPGYAMVVTDHDRAQGAILGKAMEGMDKGQRGLILVLVTLQ
jgi:hypothetical protein